MEGPKAVWVMCITVVGAVYADHYKNHFSNNWRHITLEDAPSTHLEEFDKAASRLWDLPRESKASTNDVFPTTTAELPEPTTTEVEYWTTPAQAEITTTKSPIDSEKSWFLETYWDEADDEPKPSRGSSVIIPIIVEPKITRPKGRLSIMKKKDTDQKWDISGNEPYKNELYSLE